MNSAASTAIGQPTARRVASSSSTRPIGRDDDVHAWSAARARRELAVEQQEIRRRRTRRRSRGPSRSPARESRGERLNAGQPRNARNSAMPRCSDARLGVVEDAEAERERQRRGVPELEQRPARARPQKISCAVEPAGLAPAGVGLGDESAAAPRAAFSMSRCVPPPQGKRGGSPARHVTVSARRTYLIQPFSL